MAVLWVSSRRSGGKIGWIGSLRGGLPSFGIRVKPGKYGEIVPWSPSFRCAPRTGKTRLESPYFNHNLLFSGQEKLSLVDFESQNSNLSSKLLILPSHFYCQSQFDRYTLLTGEMRWPLGCDVLKPLTHHSPLHFNNNVSLSFVLDKGFAS